MGILSVIRDLAERAWIPVQRRRLAQRGETRLARALGGHPCPLAGAIERGRADMLLDTSPLVDGSLGPAGIYDEGRTVADACRVSRNGPSAELIYSLAAEYQPKTILELGTNVGISSAYLGAAGGKVITLESSPYRIRLAQRLHRSLDVDVEYVPGLFTETLDSVLHQHSPVHMAFVDGHHQYRPTLDYFDMIAAKAAPGCMFIFDDIRWSAGMRRAWGELRANNRFETVADLGGMGICVLR